MSWPRRAQRREAHGGLPLAFVAVPAVVAAVAAAAVARRARGRESRRGERGGNESLSAAAPGSSRPPPGLVEPLEQSLFEGWAPGSDPSAVWRALAGPDGSGLIALLRGGGHQHVRASVARVAADELGVDRTPEPALGELLSAVRGAREAAGGGEGDLDAAPDVGPFAAPAAQDAAAVGAAVVLAYRTPIRAGPFAPPFADNVQAVAVVASPAAAAGRGAARPAPGLVAESLCSTAGVPFGAAVRPRVRWILWTERKRVPKGEARASAAASAASRVRISVSGACSLDPAARVPGILRGKILSGARDGMRDSYLRVDVFVRERCGGGGRLGDAAAAGAGAGAGEAPPGAARRLASAVPLLEPALSSVSSLASSLAPALDVVRRRSRAAAAVVAQRPEIAVAFALFLAVLLRIVLERALWRGARERFVEEIDIRVQGE